MEDASSKHEDLQEEFMRALHSANEETIDSIGLYYLLRLLENKYRTLDYPVPETLKHLEQDIERDIYAISQGR